MAQWHIGQSEPVLFSFDQDMRVEKTLLQTLACQLSSTLMQLLFSFDQDMGVEKTLSKALASHANNVVTGKIANIIFHYSFEQNLLPVLPSAVCRKNHIENTYGILLHSKTDYQSLREENTPFVSQLVIKHFNAFNIYNKTING